MEGLPEVRAIFVDFIDIDNPPFGAGLIIIGGLIESHQNIFDILADISGLSQNGGIGNAERDFKVLGQRTGNKSLAGPGRADKEDIRLLQLDIGLLFAFIAAASARALIRL